MPDQIILHWEPANERHVTRHGVLRSQIDDMIDLQLWVRTQNPNAGSDRRLVIGPTGLGRIITLVVRLLPDAGHRVPVAYWPSTAGEQAIYWRRIRSH